LTELEKAELTAAAAVEPPYLSNLQILNFVYLLAGRWTMDDGRWTMDDGRWTMDDGRWSMDNGRWTKLLCSSTVSFYIGCALPKFVRLLFMLKTKNVL
jgi:hypothetical protein